MPVAVILFYRKIGRYALNAIAGAIDGHTSTCNVPLILARDENEMLKAIEKQNALGNLALVCWSFYTMGFRESAEALNRVRAAAADANAIHLAGGVHASAEPEETLKFGWDLVAIGEGERTIVELICALNDGGGDWKRCCDVAGVAYLNEHGTLCKNGRGELVDLNEWPPFPLRTPRFGPIEITRGCVFACSFCQTPFVSKARFRHRSVDDVCHWAAMMRARGLRDYRFITPTAMSYGSSDESANYEAVEELLARVRETIGGEARLYYGTFPSEVRPEHLTREALSIIKKYCNNDNVIIGGQSGSQRMLDAIHRGHSVEDVRRAVHVALEMGFTPNVDFLFALPGEEREDEEATRAFAMELAEMGARIHSHTFMPLPGTPMRRERTGLITRETELMLKGLEARGKAYGQWEKQKSSF